MSLLLLISTLGALCLGVHGQIREPQAPEFVRSMTPTPVMLSDDQTGNPSIFPTPFPPRNDSKDTMQPGSFPEMPSPRLVLPLPDYILEAGVGTLFSVPTQQAFQPASGLAFTSSLASGDPLPRWLRFETSERIPEFWTVSTLMDAETVGVYRIRVKATLPNGKWASGDFILTVVGGYPTVEVTARDQVWGIGQSIFLEGFLWSQNNWPTGDLVLSASAQMLSGVDTWRRIDWPKWLVFDPEAGTLRGRVPESASAAVLNVTVTGVDGRNAMASGWFVASLQSVCPKGTYRQLRVVFADGFVGESYISPIEYLTFYALVDGKGDLQAFYTSPDDPRTPPAFTTYGITGSAVTSYGQSNTRDNFTAVDFGNSLCLTPVILAFTTSWREGFVSFLLEGSTDVAAPAVRWTLLASYSNVAAWLPYPLTTNFTVPERRSQEFSTSSISTSAISTPAAMSPYVIGTFPNRVFPVGAGANFSLELYKFQPHCCLQYTAMLSPQRPLPPWLTIDTSVLPLTFNISDSVNLTDVGTYPILVRATGPNGASVNTTFNLTLTEGPPTLNRTFAFQRVVYQGESFNIPTREAFRQNRFDSLLLFKQAGAQLYSWEAWKPLDWPTWVSLNSITGALTASTVPLRDVSMRLKITATDGAGTSATASLDFEIRRGRCQQGFRHIGFQFKTDNVALPFNPPLKIFALDESGRLQMYPPDNNPIYGAFRTWGPGVWSSKSNTTSYTSWQIFSVLATLDSDDACLIPKFVQLGKQGLTSFSLLGSTDPTPTASTWKLLANFPNVVAWPPPGTPQNFSLPEPLFTDPPKEPWVVGPLPNVTLVAGQPTNLTLPRDAFQPACCLSYSARLASGQPLPDWLSFDPFLLPLTLQATERTNDSTIGNYTITITIATAYASWTKSNFTLIVTGGPPTVRRSALPTGPLAFPKSEFRSYSLGNVFQINWRAGVLRFSATLRDVSSSVQLEWPSWLSVDATSGAVSGSLEGWPSGDFVLRLSATDEVQGGSVSAEIKLSFLGQNCSRGYRQLRFAFEIGQREWTLGFLRVHGFANDEQTEKEFPIYPFTTNWLDIWNNAWSGNNGETTSSLTTDTNYGSGLCVTPTAISFQSTQNLKSILVQGLFNDPSTTSPLDWITISSVSCPRGIKTALSRTKLTLPFPDAISKTGSWSDQNWTAGVAGSIPIPEHLFQPQWCIAFSASLQSGAKLPRWITVPESQDGSFALAEPLREGNYDIRLNAAFKSTAASLDFRLKVSGGPPSIVRAFSPRVLQWGDRVKYDLREYFRNNRAWGQLTFTKSDTQDLAMEWLFLNSGSGKVWGTVPEFHRAGSLLVCFRATDAMGFSVQQCVQHTIYSKCSRGYTHLRIVNRGRDRVSFGEPKFLGYDLPDSSNVKAHPPYPSAVNSWPYFRYGDDIWTYSSGGWLPQEGSFAALQLGQATCFLPTTLHISSTPSYQGRISFDIQGSKSGVPNTEADIDSWELIASFKDVFVVAGALDLTAVMLPEGPPNPGALPPALAPRIAPQPAIGEPKSYPPPKTRTPSPKKPNPSKPKPCKGNQASFNVQIAPRGWKKVCKKEKCQLTLSTSDGRKAWYYFHFNTLVGPWYWVSALEVSNVKVVTLPDMLWGKQTIFVWAHDERGLHSTTTASFQFTINRAGITRSLKTYPMVVNGSQMHEVGAMLSSFDMLEWGRNQLS